MEIKSADNYTLEELTDAYNQTRVDYMVPMPMNVAKLREYSNVYDVSFAHSCVAVDEDDDKLMLGLGMLGVREDRCWITRLGVLPFGRRLGTGTAIIKCLLSRGAKGKRDTCWLEVIKGNTPAHTLFRKFGFTETRELIIARRPPQAQMRPPHVQVTNVETFDHDDALELLASRQKRPNWLNETESMQNVRNLSALKVSLKNGGRGWVSYHAGVLQLTRVVVEVEEGDEAQVTAAVLYELHKRYERQDTIADNVPDDEQWPGFKQAGYFESFRRVEMIKQNLI